MSIEQLMHKGSRRQRHLSTMGLTNSFSRALDYKQAQTQQSGPCLRSTQYLWALQRFAEH